MTKSVDDYLAELRPYIDRWAVATQEEREIRRRRATAAELKTFYEAIVPNLEDIIEVLNLLPLNEMPDNARLLMNLTLSLAEIAPPLPAMEVRSTRRVVPGRRRRVRMAAVAKGPQVP